MDYTSLIPCRQNIILASLCLLPLLPAAQTQDKLVEPRDTAFHHQRFNLHFQATYIYQHKPPFHSAYEGPNSLTGAVEKQNSLTATLYFGLRLWKGGALFINPEVAGGSGLSGALGMAGSSNGETYRVGEPAPSLYLGRGYLQQTFALGSDTAHDADDENVLGGISPKAYLRIMAGKYSLGDLFDKNEYSNSARTQFMNWSLMNTGAWDYAANVRGYTYALSAQLHKGNMDYKLAVASLPYTANGAQLNTHPDSAFALNAAIERHFRLAGKEGNMRLLGYYHNAAMGSYQQTFTHVPPDTPVIESTRVKGRVKAGFAIGADYAVSDNAGLFARLGWNDGKNETWCFTEIDQTLALGASLNGAAWKRKGDVAGIAAVMNGLSADHQKYLINGGKGFILGDGKLNYSPEAIAELYYSFKPLSTGIWITGDYQLCINPGCNADRGPANIFSLRVHIEL